MRTTTHRASREQQAIDLRDRVDARPPAAPKPWPLTLADRLLRRRPAR